MKNNICVIACEYEKLQGFLGLNAEYSPPHIMRYNVSNHNHDRTNFRSISFYISLYRNCTHKEQLLHNFSVFTVKKSELLYCWQQLTVDLQICNLLATACSKLNKHYQQSLSLHKKITQSILVNKIRGKYRNSFFGSQNALHQ